MYGFLAQTIARYSQHVAASQFAEIKKNVRVAKLMFSHSTKECLTKNGGKSQEVITTVTCATPDGAEHTKDRRPHDINHPSSQSPPAQSEASGEVRPGAQVDAAAQSLDSGQVWQDAEVGDAAMKPMIVVDADAMASERRKAMFAYVGSFLAQGIAFGMGWIVRDKWELLKGIFG